MANRSAAMSSEHTRRVPHGRQSLLAIATLGAIALGGCGGGTKTVSVSSAASPHTTAQRTSTAATTPPSPTTTTQASTVTSTNATGGVEATRTTSAPAFTKESSGGEGVGAAVAAVKAHGYTAGDTSTYRPENTLRVLVGTRDGSSDGYDQQAFFFVNGRYIGTDTKEPSATVRVVGQSDTEVTLAYPLYKPGDPLGHPSGGERSVRFQLNNGQLAALDPIPPATSTTGVARN